MLSPHSKNVKEKLTHQHGEMTCLCMFEELVCAGTKWLSNKEANSEEHVHNCVNVLQLPTMIATSVTMRKAAMPRWRKERKNMMNKHSKHKDKLETIVLQRKLENRR